MAIPDSLAHLLEEGLIEEILGRIMSGKEAEVFAVLRHGAVCAAKVYKERHQRSFKHRSGYTEGRADVRDSRTRRAVASGSRFGRTQAEASWKDAEHDALQIAFQAGVRVPEPYLLYGDTLLMQLIVDLDGMPAPRLSDRAFTAEHAMELYRDLFDQVRRLLKCHRIHGDLSAFNVLLGADGPTIIDMPQVVDAAGHPQAQTFLVRDMSNLVEYLGRFAPALVPLSGAGHTLWRHYQAGTLDAADPMDATRLDRAGGRGRGPRTGAPVNATRPAPGHGEQRERGVQRFSRDGRAQARSTTPAAPRAPGRPAAAPPGRSEGRPAPRPAPAAPSQAPARPQQGPARPQQAPARPQQAPARPPQGPARPQQGPAHPSRPPRGRPRRGP